MRHGQGRSRRRRISVRPSSRTAPKHHIDAHHITLTTIGGRFAADSRANLTGSCGRPLRNHIPLSTRRLRHGLCPFPTTVNNHNPPVSEITSHRTGPPTESTIRARDLETLIGSGGGGGGGLERLLVPVPAAAAVRRGPAVERLEPADGHERCGRVNPVQALRLAGVVVAVVELVLLRAQVPVHAPAAAGHVSQYGREPGPVPRVHPAVDQRVAARVRHGQPMEQEPHVRQAAPRAQRRLVVPQYLRTRSRELVRRTTVVVFEMTENTRPLPIIIRGRPV